MNALRAFEAAARLGGFSIAAEELCVTPGAISQHIKALEAWVGAPVFERRSQGVILTPLGERALGELAAAFDGLGEAMRTLRAGVAAPPINIAAQPGVAQLWLSPRLPRLRAAFPDRRVSVTAMELAPNLNRELFDLSFFIDEPSPGTSQVALLEDWIFPVCTPEIGERLRHPRDLLGEVWIYDPLWASDWETWLHQVEPDLQSQKAGPQYSLYSIAVEEAVSGAGVVIGHEMLVEKHLKSGALVAPFAMRVRSGNSLLMDLPSQGHGDGGLGKALGSILAD